jgi:hypothetical protein
VTAVLLSVHVLAAIVLIGPVTAAASLFPRYARDPATRPVAELLHRISRGYAVVGVAVPVFGIGTAARMGVLGRSWLVVSMVLTAGAAGLLAAVIVPGQRRALARPDGEPAPGTTADPPTGEPAADRPPVAAGQRVPDLRRLSTATGVFALTWAVVVVLMIVRPGSTTGV